MTDATNERSRLRTEHYPLEVAVDFDGHFSGRVQSEIPFGPSPSGNERRELEGEWQSLKRMYLHLENQYCMLS